MFGKFLNKLNRISGILALIAVTATFLMASGQASNFARIVLGTANYGTDPNGSTVDLTFQNDEYITNSTDGTLTFSATIADFGSATVTSTGNFDITGDYVLENDEQIVNSTDGDVEIVANDSAAALLEVFVKSSLDTPNVVDNMYASLYFTFNDDSSGYTNYGTIKVLATDVSDESEDSYMEFNTFLAGTEITGLRITGNVITQYYDAAAYWTATQANAGGVTFNSVSDGTASFTFSDPVTFSDGAAVNDSIQIGNSGKYVRKFFQSTGGDSIGVVFYNTVSSAADTVFIVP